MKNKGFAVPYSASKLAMAIALTSVVSVSNAAEQLTSLNAQAVSSQLTELRLNFATQAVQPTAYLLDNPVRLVLDLPNVQNQLSNRYAEINQGSIDSITTIANETTTRLIIALNQEGNFATRVEGNQLVLSIQNTIASDVSQVTPNVVVAPIATGQQTQAFSEAKPDADGIVATPLPNGDGHADVDNTMVVKVNPLLNPATAKAASAQYDFSGLNSIDFKNTNATDGQVIIQLANSNVPVDVTRRGTKILVRMLGAKVPKNLINRLNVSQYNTPVSSILAFNEGGNGSIIIEQTKDFEYQAYQTDASLVIDVKPAKLLQPPKIEEKVYSGEKLSMEFEDVEVRQVLQLLADFTDMNLVVSDTVNGRMTLRLMNVPWDQALDIILKNRDLDKRVNGNVMMVAPAQEIAAQEQKELEAQQKVTSLAPLRTEYIQLSYSTAADIQSMISSGEGNSDDGQGSLLSSRGTVTIDARTNTIIVQDTSDRIEEIRGLIEKIDVPVKQVMIEARIVSASDTFSKELGVKWGILSNGAYSNRNLLVGSNLDTVQKLKSYNMKTQTVNGQTVSYPSYGITNANNLNVDLGVSSAGASRIALGLISLSDMMLDLEISALQADGRGEIIATPKVLTADKQAATVAAGTQIPYRVATASGASAVAFKNAELSLNVTPNITPDGRIGMKLSVNSDSPKLLENGDVGIDTNRVETNVLVNDGETVVLGGIFQNTVRNAVTKTPFLGDLPFVGQLFRKTINQNDKQELLIFVTPKLVNDSSSRFNQH